MHDIAIVVIRELGVYLPHSRQQCMLCTPHTQLHMYAENSVHIYNYIVAISVYIYVYMYMYTHIYIYGARYIYIHTELVHLYVRVCVCIGTDGQIDL